ncbi:tripartite tricarboxylate transporter substrate binding protein [Noviherbaspirillum sp. L7-7A]|uniref:Bug family tripartite tricarboxylate transporter substrate binding protein n=1 Tax=Noviherbaspirillum sp. L7-7A TaxID=2850560 RepID=UPI001C2C8BE0|nr:tripartite tricarboxylate transporter substrate binding protein [Noviherbaspirillum sp. L7-7A]MBV0882209.1 tripartite tricarboxylate transporter substrate binding protein [Noviherbaspirillum sp. L7-7A]
MSRFKKLFAVLALACAPAVALAQAYPTKPVRLVVPYSPGGGADNAARILATRLATTLGQTVVIDNRPGGSGMIGAQAVAQAEPDGYTVLYDASAFAVNPALRKMAFDPAKDLVPVSLAVTVPNIFVVPPNAPYSTVQEFVDYARKHPGKLTYASYGAGSAAHLIGELLKARAGIDLLHVPYKGGAPALTDLMGGQVDSYFANAASGMSYVKSGKLRALAVTSAKRMAAMPEVPTLAESGFKDFEVLEWNGFFVPKGTPNEVVARLAKEVQAAVKDPATRQKLQGLGLDPVGSTPEEFGRFVQAEMTRWAGLVKSNRITVD